MSDQTVSDGADAVFTCEVCGRPPPEITWSGPGHVTAAPHGSTDGRVTIKRCEVTGLVSLEVRRRLIHQKCGNEGLIQATTSGLCIGTAE
jgi:Immunoglobulin I-set domain